MRFAAAAWALSAAPHISIRYLHKLFEAEETTAADWASLQPAVPGRLRRPVRSLPPDRERAVKVAAA